VLGKKEHPDTAASYHNIDTQLYRKVDLDGALQLFETALAIQEKALGIDHYYTAATSYKNIGLVKGAMGDVVGALQIFEKSLPNIVRVHGMEHPDLIIGEGPDRHGTFLIDLIDIRTGPYDELQFAVGGSRSIMDSFLHN